MSYRSFKWRRAPPRPAIDLTAEEIAELYINIVCIGPDTRENKYRIKKTARLGRLVWFYAATSMARLNTLKFYYNGRFISDFDTPASLGMKEDDVVLVEAELLRQRK